jgi:Flp pilus assembly pilin Flp
LKAIRNLFADDERGQGTTEHGLIMSIMTIAVIAIMAVIGCIPYILYKFGY